MYTPITFTTILKDLAERHLVHNVAVSQHTLETLQTNILLSDLPEAIKQRHTARLKALS